MKLFSTRLFGILSLAIFGMMSGSAVFAEGVQSNVLKTTATHFTTIGQQASFQWAPSFYQDETHPNSFTYDIFYYIPARLKDQKNVNALIFNHGGGGSTLTRDGSIHAVSLYIGDLMKLADEIGFIVVLPSANGLNWGAHTITLMKSLAAMMRTELNIDSNHLGLSGHSMGGMGITRSFNWLADEFAFFLPLAAGMDLTYAADDVTEWQINKEFNVPYIHLQGLQDAFDIFVTRCKEQLRRTQELEVRYGVPSKLQMVFYDAGHNYDYNTFKTYLSAAFVAPRNIYQKELWGSLSGYSNWWSENNITIHTIPVTRYFWVEAMNYDATSTDTFNFHAKIVENNVQINVPVSPKSPMTLRVYLHSNMVDLNQTIDVVLNGKVVGTRIPQFSLPFLRKVDASDPAYQFEDFIDIDVPAAAQTAIELGKAI